MPASAGEQGPSKGGWGGAAPNGHALSPKSYRLSAQEEFEEAFGALRGSSAESASERHGRFPLPNFSSDGSAEEAAEEAGAVTEQPDLSALEALSKRLRSTPPVTAIVPADYIAAQEKGKALTAARDASSRDDADAARASISARAPRLLQADNDTYPDPCHESVDPCHEVGGVCVTQVRAAWFSCSSCPAGSHGCAPAAVAGAACRAGAAALPVPASQSYLPSRGRALATDRRSRSHVRLRR